MDEEEAFRRIAALAEPSGQAQESSWYGKYHLWLRPGEPTSVSDSQLSITSVLKGTFVRLDYTWHDGEAAQEGTILLGYDPTRTLMRVNWCDTWHMGHGIMNCEGLITEEGVVNVRGDYRVASGPNWGWRTEIGLVPTDVVELRMYNIPPSGEELLAVEVRYERMG